MGEKKAPHPPQGTGQRAHETLRYLLSLTWWLLILGSVLVYALWPVSQVTVTVTGALLTLGNNTVRAEYSGDVAYNAATASTSITVSSAVSSMPAISIVA